MVIENLKKQIVDNFTMQQRTLQAEESAENIQMWFKQVRETFNVGYMGLSSQLTEICLGFKEVSKEVIYALQNRGQQKAFNVINKL